MVNGPCPNCFNPNWFSTYANGSIETGYCQRCGFESQTKTTKNDAAGKMIDVARPRPKQGAMKGKR